MKIYKFGGSSIKNYKRIKNLSKVIKINKNNNKIMVLSAIGKNTNKLEKVVKNFFIKNNTYIQVLNIYKNHFKIIKNLFIKNHFIFKYIKFFFNELIFFFKKKKSIKYHFIYDQIVGSGELISTKIVSEYLNLIGFPNFWLDCRNYLKTDNSYREAHVNWQQTKKKIKQINKNFFYITQGFIGADNNYFTTTFGREGSDYTASIFSFCLNAESQTTWKDVPGILNADPRFFLKKKIFKSLSYKETLELSYYGASVIHPKTLYPLKEKKIPLYIRSFIFPKKKGTLVSAKYINNVITSCFIVKKQQKLIFFSKKKFSFFLEKDISFIFKYISYFKINFFLIQNSPISISICIEDKFNNLYFLIKKLKKKFIIKLLNNVYLYTLLHYNVYNINFIIKKYKLILRQINSDYIQWILKLN
ncbi:aspartate kinase [Candidatus Karelsulcia muelleri]|uniref:Aspartokinase n=1 Tax=Candidatus Karelsulcia muelleri PSPU TaxID=1189303 RepID=A0AAD1EX90_9FLAO|nr:aspartate kinase [Candidatus Karelsulcia muelleri]NJJ98868.1 aspartate kinase [Candidatus Karelsulcia muelleri]BAO66223.1 aspartokinase [Candidatus Karelsulcia muelleri PSPU]